MALSVPKRCPWCDAEIIKRTGPEQTALLGRFVYACGTVISVYGAMIQVTSIAHPEHAGWSPHEQV